MFLKYCYKILLTLLSILLKEHAASAQTGSPHALNAEPMESATAALSVRATSISFLARVTVSMINVCLAQPPANTRATFPTLVAQVNVLYK